jgi:hypothetical protein
VRPSRIVDADQLNRLPARICPQCAADEEHGLERVDEPEWPVTAAFDEFYG